MDLNLNEAQEMLRTTARDFLTNNCPPSLVRDMTKDDRGYPLELWRKMAELGWMGLEVPERYGGSGGSFLDMTVLLEELGRACLPGPFVPTIIGASILLEAGSDAQKREFLPKIASGNLILTLALAEADASYDLASLKVTATADGEGYVINGTKLFVPDANVADSIICVARTGAGRARGLTLFLADAQSRGLKRSPLKTFAGNKLSEVVFDRVRVPQAKVLGQVGRGRDYLKTALAKGAVAMCAQMLGAAQRALGMSVEHSKQRVQFGRPVGSFQAVQFHCADMMTDVDGARLLTYQAAWRLSEGLPCAKEVAIAKAWVNDAFTQVMSLGHEVQGGVAIMDDHDMPLYSKRALGWQAGFGGADFHREVIAQELGL